MARLHRGVAIAAIGVVGVGFILAKAVPTLGGTLLSAAFGRNEQPKIVAAEPAFAVEVGEKPRPVKEPEPERPPTLREQVRERPERQRSERSTAAPKPTLSEKWLAKVNDGGMYTFGESSGDSRGLYSTNGECRLLQPIRVRAMIADSATTDEPGMAIGTISEDVQGVDSSGGWCVAVPGGAVVSFHVTQAGEYATNRAPTQVGSIWMADGFEVPVGQPAKHIDGIPGVIGTANHHVASKTTAAFAGTLFRVVNNLTRIGQVNVSSGDVTDPFEDMIRKRLERPSEITFSGQTVEFDLMPTATPGY
jgi:hypothetical protein